MRKADTTIKYVEPYSIAEEAGIETGDKLVTVNGHEVHDILEYRYLTAEYEVTLEILKKDGTTEFITVENDYDDLGIEFEESLIDEAQSCTNKCIFCFIDQLPKGMRETVYFKDDDTRLSFLQGNYVTLTNMSDEEIDRLIAMRVSPINVSVHATDPELRCKMLNNRFAGKCYDIMKKFAENDIYMNCQIVLCPEINDGEQLKRTLTDLGNLFPYVNSISVVPVGLTRYRDGLYPLKPFTAETSRETIEFVEAIQNDFLERLGTRLVYLSDEFYVNAEIPVPQAEEYEGFPQIENGVGLCTSLKYEFKEAIKLLGKKPVTKKTKTVPTGMLAYDLMTELCAMIDGDIRVVPVQNRFFGENITVTGLITGGDLVRTLERKELGDEVIISAAMLRHEEAVFLDDMTLDEAEERLGVKITPVANDGYELLEALLK